MRRRLQPYVYRCVALSAEGEPEIFNAVRCLPPPALGTCTWAPLHQGRADMGLLHMCLHVMCMRMQLHMSQCMHVQVRFGAVVENVIFDADTREIDYNDVSITENTRCAYPLQARRG